MTFHIAGSKETDPAAVDKPKEVFGFPDKLNEAPLDLDGMYVCVCVFLCSFLSFPFVVVLCQALICLFSVC